MNLFLTLNVMLLTLCKMFQSPSFIPKKLMFWIILNNQIYYLIAFEKSLLVLILGLKIVFDINNVKGIIKF
jgi:hypothetical protein